jgi:sugar lactone lactonase YvrE
MDNARAAAWDRVVAQADQLGESPFWHPQEQRLYWVDLAGRTLRRIRPGEAVAESWVLPQEPGCIAPARSGGLVLAMRDGIYRAPAWQGELTRLQPAAHDPSIQRYNDGKADPLGRFWAGTIHEPKDRALAALFSLDLRPGLGDAVLHRQLDGATTANGLAWSPDGRTLYWADTPAHTIWAWDWDAAANRLGGQRVFAQFPGKPPGWQRGDAGYGGRPDGAAVDAQGNYWCAMYEGGRVLQLSPRGELLRELPTPMPCPTMPCFGGPDLRTLFVTGVGSVVSTQVEVPGLPVNFFID